MWYCSSTLTFGSVLSVEPGLSSTPPTGICHRGQTEVGAPGTRLNTRMRTPVLIVKGFLFLSLSQCWTSLAHKKCAIGTNNNIKVALFQWTSLWKVKIKGKSEYQKMSNLVETPPSPFCTFGHSARVVVTALAPSESTLSASGWAF